MSFRSLGKDMTVDSVKSLTRDNLEADLNFIALLLFRNELKSDSRSAIVHLRDGEVCK